MILKTLELKNFLSFRDLKLDFPQGLFLFDGYNYDDETANGAGKSAVFDAVSYVLYGKTPRKCKLNDFIKWNNSLLFSKVVVQNNDDLYSIVRTRNPDSLELYINDRKFTEYIDVNELNDKIISLLGITYNSFVSSVYFAQNRSENFLVTSDDNKKKILTEIIKISKFDRGLSLVKTDFNSTVNSLDMLINSEKMLKSSIDGIIKDIKDYEQLSICKKEDGNSKKKYIENKIGFLLEKIDKNLLEIKTCEVKKLLVDECKASILELEKKKEELAEVSNKIIELRSERKNLGNKIIEKYEEVKKYEDFLRKKMCFTCGQSIYEVDRMTQQRDSISAEIKVFKDKEVVLLNDINSLTDFFNLHKPKIYSQYDECICKYNDSIMAEKTIQSLTLDNKMVECDIEQCKKDLNSLDDVSIDVSFFKNKKESELKIKESELSDLHKKILIKSKEVKLLDHLKVVFGKDGVRAIAFNQIIDELNSSIDSYVQKLFEQSISLKLELKTDVKNDGKIVDKIETKLIKNGREIDFYILSGGEQKRLVLAVDFALAEIVSRRNHNNFEFIVLDECFGGLDMNAKSKVMDFLNSLKSAKSQIYVVDHSSEFKSRFDQVIMVEKRNGVSEISNGQ